MLLTDAQVADFNRAYAEAFDTELPPHEAQAMLGDLVELYTRLIAFAREHPAQSADDGLQRARSSAH
jgi:hypothetical protein